MKTASDRKNRRVPILSLFFILISTVLTLVCSILQRQATTVMQFIATLIYNRLFYGVSSVASALSSCSMSIIVSFMFYWVVPLSSAIAFFVITILSLTKSKGGALAITSGVAIIGNAVKCISSLLCGFCLVLGSIILSDINSENIIEFVIYHTTFLPEMITYIFTKPLTCIILTMCWLAFEIACLCSIFYHKTNKKSVKTTAKVLAIIFGIGGSSMFLVRIADIIQNVISYLFTAILNLLLNYKVGHTILNCIPSFFSALFFAGIFIFANILGFVGMILLITYLLNPYKKGKKYAEAVECECTDHTECECCGEEAEHECSCTDECTCEVDTDTIDPSPDTIVELPNA